MAPSSQRIPPGVYVLFASVAAMVIGSFMPWLKVTAPFVGTITRSGVDDGGDGVVIMVIAAVIGVMALKAINGSPKFRTATAVVASIGGIIVAVALFFDAQELSDRFQDAQDTSNLISTSYGEGLYLCAIGAALALVGAPMIYKFNSDESI